MWGIRARLEVNLGIARLQDYHLRVLQPVFHRQTKREMEKRMNAKMNDVDVAWHMQLFALSILAVPVSLIVLLLIRRKLSRPIILLYLIVFVGGLVTSVIYQLNAGTSARGFLD